MGWARPVAIVQLRHYAWDYVGLILDTLSVVYAITAYIYSE